jgi:hypothetical protein
MEASVYRQMRGSASFHLFAVPIRRIKSVIIQWDSALRPEKAGTL